MLEARKLYKVYQMGNVAVEALRGLIFVQIKANLLQSWGLQVRENRRFCIFWVA